MALNLKATGPAAPPRKPGRPPAPAKTDPRIQARTDAAQGFFQLLGFGCVITGQLADAGAIGRYGPPIANELVKASETSEPIGNLLDLLGKTGPYAGLIITVMPLALQVLVNHKMLQADMFAGAGVVHPEALEAQVKADLARQQSEAMRAQREAEAELQEFLRVAANDQARMNSAEASV